MSIFAERKNGGDAAKSAAPAVGEPHEGLQAVSVTIRAAVIRDAEALTDFNRAMAMETEQKQLDRDTVMRGVLGLLERPEAGFYLVGESNGAVVAGLMVTYEWSDWRNGTFWWIQSVYVLPAYRRRGVFTELFRGVRRLAQERDDVCGLRLYVEQQNHVAQATYRSLGMDETHYDMYEIDFS